MAQVYNTPPSLLRPDASQERGGLLNTPLKEYLFPWLKENIFTLPEPDPRYEKGIQFPSLITTAEDREKLSRISEQEQKLDEALMAQGMPTISGYTSPYEQKPIQTRDDIQQNNGGGMVDTGVVSPEDFIQNAYSQYGEPATAFPVPQRSEEEKKATQSRFAGLSDIFDNKEALGKIALGISLLEGTPMTEAFALYKEFGSGEIMQVELYDNELGRVVDVGSEDNARILAKYREDPNRYSIGPINSHRSAKSERDDELAAAITEFDLKTLEKEVMPRKYDAQNQLASAEQLLNILNDPNFESGPGTEFKLKFTRLGQVLGIGDSETVDKQVLFQRIVSKLIPTMREPGSGSTSDFEIELYRLATAGLDLTPEQNREFVENMIYYNKMQIARANYARRTVEKGGSLIDAEEDFSALINRARDGSLTTDVNNYDYTEDELNILNSVFGGIPIDEESAKDINFLKSLQDKYGTDVNFEVTKKLPMTSR